MGFPANKSGNPQGISSVQKRSLRKMHHALDKAIDGLGKATRTEGTTVMAELITEAMQKDIVGTLSKLAQFFPKNVNIDVNHNHNLKLVTDDDLIKIIADNTKDINTLEHDGSEGEPLDTIAEPLPIESAEDEPLPAAIPPSD